MLPPSLAVLPPRSPRPRLPLTPPYSPLPALHGSQRPRQCDCGRPVPWLQQQKTMVMLLGKRTLRKAPDVFLLQRCQSAFPFLYKVLLLMSPALSTCNTAQYDPACLVAVDLIAVILCIAKVSQIISPSSHGHCGCLPRPTSLKKRGVLQHAFGDCRRHGFDLQACRVVNAPAGAVLLRQACEPQLFDHKRGRVSKAPVADLSGQFWR